MIRLLSLVGRATIVVSAILIVVASAMTRNHNVDLHPYLAAYGFERQVGALVGFAIGVVAAGIVLGPLATLYDIRDNLRRLAKLGESAPTRGERGTDERKGLPSVRIEPRLT